MNKKVIYIFGAGKIGKKTIEFLNKIHLTVSGVFDNDDKKWGTEVVGVPVMKFDRQYFDKKDSFIYVACSIYEDILKQLKNAGISDRRIVVVDSVLADAFLNSIGHHIISMVKAEILETTSQFNVLFDLSGGMVLGGVEQWNYELAAKLKEKEINAAYFVVTYNNKKLENTIYPSIRIEENSHIIYYVKKIMKVKPKVIICNFPFSIMKAACIVKRWYDKNLKIIAIIHNDLDIYYETYAFWEKEIDVCVGISKKIEKNIKSNKQLAKKFFGLHWKVSIYSNKNSRYSKDSEPVRIGYAGRIVVHQKRLDRTILIAENLMKRNVNFKIQFAGDGIYRIELENLIRRKNLQKYIELVGRLNHNQMQEFWESQDIYLNCSDYEGHSIAQSEAMASGAVPVMMDVSGAEDDIENGKNGFIVPMGDVNAMAEKIDWLFRNRSQLPILGMNARKKIEENNKLADRDLEMLLSEIVMATL